MTFLLRNLWQNVLKSSPYSPILRPRSLSSNLSEATHPKAPDSVMMSIKTAPSVTDVLGTIQNHLPAMNHKHMLQALRSIFELQKAGKFPYDSDTLIKDPSFGNLCQHFKRHARALEVHEAIEAVKVLTYLRVPADSLIVQTMLQIIRYHINEISIRQIMFLDYLLSQLETKNHLVDALKFALPLAFQIHLPYELDKQDLLLLKDMLMFCSTHDVPDRCINNVVTGLLLHDQAIDAQIAKSIVWSLCLMNCTEDVFPTRVQLLHTCYDILSKNLNQLSYDDVLKTVARIKGRLLERHTEYYHEQLMDATAKYVIDNEVEFEKGLLIARVLSRIAHTHLALVEYLCDLAASNPVTLANARTNILFGFVNCLSNNNFTPDPDQWTELQRQISSNPILDGQNFALPWTKLCLELASLGCYEEKVIKRVFSKEFLEEYLDRENNTLDYIQLLTLNAAVTAFQGEKYKLPKNILEKAKAMYPYAHALTGLLEEHIAKGLGGREYIVKNVALPMGFIADIVMCLKGGYPVKLPRTSNDTKVPVSNLSLPEGAILVCVISFNPGCYSMNSNRLRGVFRLILDIFDKEGYVAVAININEWTSAPEHERIPYLMREIRYKCGEIGMKLSVT